MVRTVTTLARRVPLVPHSRCAAATAETHRSAATKGTAHKEKDVMLETERHVVPREIIMRRRITGNATSAVTAQSPIHDCPPHPCECDYCDGGCMRDCVCVFHK